MKKKIIFILFILVFSHIPQYLCIEISSPSAIVISRKTGRVLYNKNGYEKRKMASLTKMMTSIIFVENCKMDEEITINKAVDYIGGSTAGIKGNDTILAENLLYGMLLPSGNDCALAIAYHVGGNVENFAALMNKKAQDLGLSDTHFKNPHGLDDDEHYSSCYSMAQITRCALSYPEILKVFSTNSINLNLGSFNTTLSNTNRLMRTYPKTIGGKTGFTNGANRCLINYAKDDETGLELISVVLGSETTDQRFNDSKAIQEYCFENYKEYSLDDFLHIYINIPVEKGNIDEYTYTYDLSHSESLTQEEYNGLYANLELSTTTITTPMQKGANIGKYSLYNGTELLYSKDLYLEYDIFKNTPLDYFKKMLKTMSKDVSTI